MTTQLAQHLYQLMRGAARRTTLEGLRSRGHSTVAVMNFREVQDLIAQAVENTLQRRGLSLEHGGIHDEVRHEFLALMRERDALQEVVDAMLHEREELQRNRAELRDELSKAAAEYESAQREPPAQELGDLAQLLDRLRSSFRSTLGHAGVDGRVIERAVNLVTHALSEHQELLAQRSKAAQDLRLGQLQRRMGKLRRKLQETEQLLARAQAAGAEGQGIAGEPVEPGVKPGDPAYTMKKELLSEIFRLNVELRQMLNRN